MEELLAARANSSREICRHIGARRMLFVSGRIMNSIPCPPAQRVTCCLTARVALFFERLRDKHVNVWISSRVLKLKPRNLNHRQRCDQKFQTWATVVR